MRAKKVEIEMVFGDDLFNPDMVTQEYIKRQLERVGLLTKDFLDNGRYSIELKEIEIEG